MRISVAFIAALMLSLCGCKGLIEPSESKVTRHFDLSGTVNHLEIKSMVDIELRQGNVPAADVTCYRSFADAVDIYIHEKTLYIRHHAGMRWYHGYDRIKVVLTLPELPVINIRAPVSIVTAQKFQTPMVYIVDWGNFSDCRIDADAAYVVLHSSGDSYSRFRISGRADSATVYCRGSALFEMSGLQLNRCVFFHSGIADASVSVSELLKVGFTGTGRLYYSGKPQVVVTEGSAEQLVRVP